MPKHSIGKRFFSSNLLMRLTKKHLNSDTSEEFPPRVWLIKRSFRITFAFKVLARRFVMNERCDPVSMRILRRFLPKLVTTKAYPVARFVCRGIILVDLSSVSGNEP